MRNHIIGILLTLGVMMGAAACQPVQSPVSAKAEVDMAAPTIAPLPHATDTAQRIATVAPTSTSTLQPTATAQPAPTATLTPHGATGKRITGRVLWGNEPVPGGRVELRLPDWRTNPDSLVMKSVADGTGAYVLVNPPVGPYEVVPAWPEGVTDGTTLAPGMPVTVVAGQEVAGVDVWLAKKLKLLEPAAGSEVGATPTLRWEAFPNARRYRVIVTDFATMEGFVGEDTAETSLPLTTPLPAGRTLTWVVNALDAQMGLLAEDTIEFTVKKSP